MAACLHAISAVLDNPFGCRRITLRTQVRTRMIVYLVSVWNAFHTNIA